MKVAIVGSGISGLAAAHSLLGSADVTLFEAGKYFGGHTHTVDVTLPTAQGDVTHGVDTGFLVFNERTYPGLIKLFAALNVVTAKSDMSFSVQSQNPKNGKYIEWSGTSLNALFAQRGNIVSWQFLKMLADVLRFNSLCELVAARDSEGQMRQTVGDFLKENRFSDAFCEGYFLPMAACIWSCPTAQMLAFPMATMIRFCHNHGLLQITNRPQWWTVQGGAKHYVEKIASSIADKRLNTPVRRIERVGKDRSGLGHAGVRISTDATQEWFDAVIIATHSDEALALLNEPTQLERTLLSAIKYHPNRAVLHTDASVLPTRKAAWAAWNYERAGETSGVCLHYLINRLQPLPWPQPVVVSLNPLRETPPQHVLGEYAYAHPVFDTAAIKAQRQIPWLQGQHSTYYCGAWMGYGFHEDGLKAGQLAATQLLSHQGNHHTDTPLQVAA
jgi:uncharacterized protein